MLTYCVHADRCLNEGNSADAVDGNLLVCVVLILTYKAYIAFVI